MSGPNPSLPLTFQTFCTLLREGLREDGYALDWTSMGLPRGRRARAKILAKADGVFYGADLIRAAAFISEEIGFPFKAKALLPDGSQVRSGSKLADFSGDAQGILALERPMLNLAGYLSGIATRTRKLVDRVESEGKKQKLTAPLPRVTATRKILPHYRDVAIAAVMAGGGYSHRVNLAGGVLIKENHVAAAGGIPAAVKGVRKSMPHGLKVEIEVRNPSELRQALAEKVDVIMLDNFSPAAVRSALAVVASAGYSPLIECSGGISESTIGDYVQSGVHVLSIGGLTHSVTAFDLSLLIS